MTEPNRPRKRVAFWRRVRDVIAENSRDYRAGLRAGKRHKHDNDHFFLGAHAAPLYRDERERETRAAQRQRQDDRLPD